MDFRDIVWKVYKNGLSRSGIKLWSILPVLFFISAIAFGLWLILNQGQAYVSFNDIKGTKDYRVVVKIVDGLWFKKVLLANVYSNGANSLGLDKNKAVNIEYLDLDGDEEDEIIISGSSFGGNIIKYVLNKEGNEFRKVYNINRFGSVSEAFSSEQIFFKNIDDDRELEVIEEYKIPYKNAPYQIWSTYYDLTKNGIYQFVKLEKIDM